MDHLFAGPKKHFNSSIVKQIKQNFNFKICNYEK